MPHACTQNDKEIYKMVLGFLSPSSSELDKYFERLAHSSGPGLCHPLGVLRLNWSGSVRPLNMA